MNLSDWFANSSSNQRDIRLNRRLQHNLGRSGRRRRVQMGKRLNALEADVGYLALLLTSIVQKLDDQGVLTREDLSSVMAEFDEADGVVDGRLDLDLLRSMNTED